MLSQQDLKQIAQKGITQEQIENQLNEFKTGFPFLKLEAAAGIGRGIIAPDAAARKQYEDIWNAYKAAGKRVVKFVPASGDVASSPPMQLHVSSMRISGTPIRLRASVW